MNEVSGSRAAGERVYTAVAYGPEAFDEDGPLGALPCVLLFDPRKGEKAFHHLLAAAYEIQADDAGREGADRALADDADFEVLGQWREVSTAHGKGWAVAVAETRPLGLGAHGRLSPPDPVATIEGAAYCYGTGVEVHVSEDSEALEGLYDQGRWRARLSFPDGTAGETRGETLEEAAQDALALLAQWHRLGEAD